MTTKQQDKGTWTRVCSLLPFPPPSKVNQEKAASLRKVQEPRLCGARAAVTATLSVRLSLEQQDDKRGDNTQTRSVSTAQLGAPGLGSTTRSAWPALEPGYPCEDVQHKIQNTTGLFN